MPKYYAILDLSEAGGGDVVNPFNTEADAQDFVKNYDCPTSVAVDVSVLAEARAVIYALTGLALGMNEDDPFIYERNNGEEIVNDARVFLAKYKEPTA